MAVVLSGVTLPIPAASGSRFGLPVAAGNYTYYFPVQTELAFFIRFDPATLTATTIPTPTATAYASAIEVDGNIWLTSRVGTPVKVTKWNIASNTFTAIDASPAGTGGTYGWPIVATVGGVKRIVYGPRSDPGNQNWLFRITGALPEDIGSQTNNFLVVNTATNTATRSAFTHSTKVKMFGGRVVHPDGFVYWFPSNETTTGGRSVVRLNPQTMQTSGIAFPTGGIATLTGAPILGPDNRIYAVAQGTTASLAGAAAGFWRLTVASGATPASFEQVNSLIYSFQDETSLVVTNTNTILCLPRWAFDRSYRIPVIHPNDFTNLTYVNHTGTQNLSGHSGGLRASNAITYGFGDQLDAGAISYIDDTATFYNRVANFDENNTMTTRPVEQSGRVFSMISGPNHPAPRIVYFATTLPPAITSISPSSGPEAGGTIVTITGTDLAGVTVVRFGAIAAASFVLDSPTQITAVSPPGTGSVHVTVTTPFGTSPSTAADLFTYIPPPPPSRTSRHHIGLVVSGSRG